jgi:chromosome segregation protein
MKLKKLEISGFKSFYDKASIEFPSGITAVVGPNGCGKSNVIDAIRWVMGEQSVKQLRGKSMEDVIFAGTNGKAPLGMAEVSLTLLNDNGSAPEELKDFTEIELTRRLYRSGESAYFINRRPCRLKDIHNIFLGSGLGSKSYAFIQQGNIGIITEAGPEERRHFVEEAAGTTRYKAHKAEALRKIESTQQNLLRVSDIIAEIRRQMESLKRQARKAELFNKYQSRVKALDIRLANRQFESLTAQIEAAAAVLQELKDADVGHTAELKQLDAAVERIKLDRSQKNQAISDQKNRRFELQRGIDRFEKDLEHLRAELERLGRETVELEAARQSLDQQSRGMQSEIAQQEAENDALREAIAAVRARAEQARAVEEQMNAELAALTQESERAKARLINLMSQEAQHRNRHQSAATNRDSLTRRLKRADEEEALARQRMAEAQEREARAQARAAALKAELEELAARQAEVRGRVEEKSRALAAQVKLAQRLDLERNTARSKLAALKKMEENFDWYKDGVKAVMRRARAAGPEEALGGIVGLVADVIEPEPAVASAVEAALGDALQYVIVADQEAGAAAIADLKARGAGRCGFIPAAGRHDTAPAPAERPDPQRLLLRHVAVKPGFEGIAAALLGNAVLAESLAEALELFRLNGRVQTIVTRQGDLVSPKGFLIGGSGETAGGILSKKNELRELERQARALEAELEQARGVQKAIESEVRRLDTELQQLIEKRNRGREEEIDAEKALYKAAEELKGQRRQLEIIQLEQEQLLGEASDLDDEIGRADRALAAIAADIAAAQAAAAELSQGRAACEERLKSHSRGIVDLRLEQTALQAKLENSSGSLKRLRDFQADSLRRLSQLAQEISQKAEKIRSGRGRTAEIESALKEMYRQLAELDRVIEASEADYAAIDMRLKESDERMSAIQGEREKNLERLRLLELERAQLALKRDHAVSQIEERYQSPFAELRTLLPPEAEPAPDTEALEGEIARFRTKIARIGEVNLGAIREYQQLRERCDFLTTQKEDLEKAVADLHKVIHKINTVSQERFIQTFQAINEKLKEVFPRLFNGGTAELILTDPDKPLETGVEFMIHPPGKKLTRMSLLSGGEKAMAAIAFIFAIFLIRPASFCLMDEIDAPLDDANVYRFNDLLQHIGGNSQIIMITHNKRTMEFADTLFGVTMEQKGLSKIVSVNLKRPESAAA